MKTDTTGEDADAKSEANVTPGLTEHADDAEAQLRPVGSVTFSNAATEATSRRSSSIQRRVSLLKKSYSRANRSNATIQGETMDTVLGDMAHTMAENEDLALRNAELSLKLNKMGIKMLTLVALLASLAVATGVTTYFAINDSKASIQGSIADSVVTKVEVDELGTAHLTDKDGRDMSMRATGDLYSATIIEDVARQRTLYCLSVEDAASMAHSIASGSDAHLALMDKSGSLEKEILSLSGDFQDAGDTLHFGSGRIHVHLNDNSCNDASAKENLSRRGLDEQPFPQVKQLDVLARNRKIYAKSRSALKDGQRVLGDEVSIGIVPVTTWVSCALTGAPPDPSAADYASEKEQWMSNFKPCGWHKENCDNLSNTIVIEANVDYPPNSDEANDADEDLIKGENYIVQFDVGIHPAVVEATQEPYAKFFAPEGQESVIRLSNGFDLTKPDDGFIADSGYVVGETCLEVYTQVSLGTTILNYQPGNHGDWGDIYGNSYDCMGKCGPGCLGGGYARDCIKHDICGAFVSVAKGVASSGNCMDVDCGDEQMQTVAHCHKNGQNVICNQEDQGQDVRITLGSHGFSGSGGMGGQEDEAACFVWTGWEHGQGTPSAFHDIGEGCPSKTHCESHRCDGYIVKECLEALENGERCNEASDCISGFCGGAVWNRRCRDP